MSLLANISQAHDIYLRDLDMPHVYFIQRGKDGPVKIGRSKNVLGRLRELQTGSPEPLRIIGLQVLGDSKHEARLHQACAADRISGEWFRPSLLVLDLAADTYRSQS